MSGMTIFLAVGDEHTSTLPDGASLVSISFLAAKSATGERWEVFTANGLYGRTAGAWIDSETIVRSPVDPQVMVAARPVDQHRESATDPDTPPPTWEEARSRAEVLRELGVDVRINERFRVIRIRDGNDELHDLADGTPARQEFYPDGAPRVVEHYTNGELHDPADGTPAFQGFYPNGTPMWISHWTNGNYHDLADGTPAVQGFYSDGRPMSIGHYANGELVSEESFPPPVGEA